MYMGIGLQIAEQLLVPVKAGFGVGEAQVEGEMEGGGINRVHSLSTGEVVGAVAQESMPPRGVGS